MEDTGILGDMKIRKILSALSDSILTVLENKRKLAPSFRAMGHEIGPRKSWQDPPQL